MKLEKNRQFGEQLKKLRESYMLTQVQAAALLGIDRDTYARWEQGRRNFQIWEIIGIKEYLKRKVEANVK